MIIDKNNKNQVKFLNPVGNGILDSQLQSYLAVRFPMLRTVPSTPSDTSYKIKETVHLTLFCLDKLDQPELNNCTNNKNRTGYQHRQKCKFH